MQSTLDQIIQEVVEAVPMQLKVYAVEIIDDTFKLWTTNTFFLTKNFQVTLDGDVYTVIDFSQDEYIVVTQIPKSTPRQ